MKTDIGGPMLAEVLSQPAQASIASIGPSLLVAVDATASSQSVARVVGAIACSAKAPVHVLTVVAGGPQDPSRDRRLQWTGNPADARRRSVIRELASACPAAGRWPVAVEAGDVVSVITEKASELGVDVIAMGLPELHGESSLRDNVVKRVLRRTRVPVLGIAPNAYRQPRAIVAAVDFTPSSIQAAACAARLIAPAGTLYLVHVCPEFYGNEFERQEVGSAYTSVVGGAFHRLASTFRTAADVRIEQVQLHGLPYERLSEFAAEVDADLIAVGSHRLEQMVSIGKLPVALLKDGYRSVLIAPPARAAIPIVLQAIAQ